MERLSKKILDNICFSEQIFQRKQSSGAPVKTLIKLSKKSRQYLLLRTDISKKTVIGCSCKDTH